MVPQVDRKQVLAYRAATQELDRTTRGASKLAVFDIGFQDTPSGSAAIGLAARLAEALSNEDLIADESLALAWTIRGAPHPAPARRPSEVDAGAVAAKRR